MYDDSMAYLAASYTKFPVETLFISPDNLYSVLRDAVKLAAGNRKVKEIDTSILGESDACKMFRAAAQDGTFLIIRCPQSFPSRLRHFVYVYYKDEAIMNEDGCSHSYQNGADGFGVILWMTPEAYLEMNELDRQRFLQVAKYRFYYPKQADGREDINKLTSKERALRENAFKTLKSIQSVEERRRIFLEIFPPQPRTGFEGFDDPLLKLIKDAAYDRDSALQSFLISVFAEYQDYYLLHQSFNSGFLPDRLSIEKAAQALVSAPYLGGQYQPYWDALGDLASHPLVRNFMVTLLRDYNQRMIEAENVLYVLDKVGTWPDLIPILQDVARNAKEPEARYKASRLLRSDRQVSNKLSKDEKRNVVDLMLGVLRGKGSDLSRPEDSNEDFSELYLIAREMLGEEPDTALDKELKKLASFQALIMDDPEVTTYCKSVRTLQRAAEMLPDLGRAEKAIEYNHLASVAEDSACAKALRKALKSLK